MAPIKNVALAGATGDLGVAVLDALVKSGKFNITVLARASTSTINLPSSVKSTVVDFDSVHSLAEALRIQDAVVSTVGAAGFASQTTLIDASIAAGVRRFIPSEFGSDLENPRTRAFPIYATKIAVDAHLEAAARAHPALTYTRVRNGGFLDWGIERGFLLDWKSGAPAIYDGGDRLFSATTLASIGLAVVGVLDHPEETENKTVRIHDIAITQNRLLAVVRKLAPHLELNPVHVSTEHLLKTADAKVAKGEFTVDAVRLYLYVGVFGEGYGGLIENPDNELLGVPGNLTDAEVEVILKPILAAAT